MKKQFIFTVYGEPRGKGRPRFTRNGRTYTPAETAQYERMVRTMFLSRYPRAEKIGKDIPVRAKINAYYKIPDSAGKAKKQLMRAGLIKPTKKADADNVAKAILDALNGFAYHDDAQVVELEVKKLYAQSEPYIDVLIEEVGE